MAVYDHCPSFVDVPYIMDLIALGLDSQLELCLIPKKVKENKKGILSFFFFFNSYLPY